MQTCGAGSNWGSAGSSTGQVCILGKQASLVAACKRFIRPQVTCKLRKSTGGPCTCDVPWWSVYMRLPLIPAKTTQDPLTQHQGESFGPNRIAWRISLGCSDSISSPRTGVEAILTELGPETQNRRYAASRHI